VNACEPYSLTAAPAFRAVDALSGRVAEADMELERLREENAGLRCRVEELESERDSWRARTGR
jgi:hypothetical protein